MTILDPKKHQRLIEELHEVSHRAGIPPRYIEQSMTEHCGEAEVDFVRRYPDLIGTSTFGAVVSGAERTQALMAMCGAYTRNFVFAQVTPLSGLLDTLKGGVVPTCSVLLIPSFHRPSTQGSLTAFQIGLLWSLIEGRMMNDQLTVVGVQSIAKMKQDYGAHFADLFANHYEAL